MFGLVFLCSGEEPQVNREAGSVPVCVQERSHRCTGEQGAYCFFTTVTAPLVYLLEKVYVGLRVNPLRLMG